QRNGVTLEALCKLNGLKKNSVIKLGQILKIGQQITVSDTTGRSEPSKSRAATGKKPKRSTHVVQAGETLGQIAIKHDMDCGTLCKLNGIKKTSIIKKGQILKIGQSEVVASTPKQATISEPAKNRGTAQKSSTYTVRSGDTLSKIASSSNMDLATLCKLNGFNKDTTIRPGQKLKIVSREQVTTTKRSSADKKENAAKKKSSAKTHTTKSGENLWSIAQKYNTSTQLICQLNGFSTKSILQPGTKIKLP
ncbi:MAG: LysM peptidoglycan-binding domain-containing protein, partial [Desulforhabdus sp.]|nr:LysM peptidoglycan-binding domain-containing protein [Desulforhabdus sp.]